jgi:hypothetical protein
MEDRPAYGSSLRVFAMKPCAPEPMPSGVVLVAHEWRRSEPALQRIRRHVLARKSGTSGTADRLSGDALEVDELTNPVVANQLPPKSTMPVRVPRNPGHPETKSRRGPLRGCLESRRPSGSGSLRRHRRTYYQRVTAIGVVTTPHRST